MFFAFALVVLITCAIQTWRAFDDLQGEGLAALFWSCLTIYAVICLTYAYTEKVAP